MRRFRYHKTSASTYLLLWAISTGIKSGEASAENGRSNGDPSATGTVLLSSAASTILDDTGWIVVIPAVCDVPVRVGWSSRPPVETLSDLVHCNGFDLMQTLARPKSLQVTSMVRQSGLKHVEFADRLETRRPLDRCEDAKSVDLQMVDASFEALVCEVARLSGINLAYDPAMLTGGTYSVTLSGVSSLDFLRRQVQQRGLQLDYWVRNDAYLIHGGLLNPATDMGAHLPSDVKCDVSQTHCNYSLSHIVISGVVGLVTGALIGRLKCCQPR